MLFTYLVLAWFTKMKVVLSDNTAAEGMVAKKILKNRPNVYTKLYAIMNPPMFTPMNSNVSHAKSTTAFNTVMAHFC